MIYVTFDSNIWIYSLDESWKAENPFDSLENWIRNKDIKLILPKLIIEEWKRNQEPQTKEREKRLSEFFIMAEEILPSAFFSEYKEKSVQKTIVEQQLNRTKELINNSDIFPEYKEVNDRVIIEGIAKNPPMHKKSSIADAMIIYSLIQFAKLNQGNHFYFISNNTDDFYQKNNNGKPEIHDFFKSDFNNYNIKAFRSIEQLNHSLEEFHGLMRDESFELKIKESLRNKIKEKVYNPEYYKIAESAGDSYIQNINTLKYILNENFPTKEQFIFVLALADSDKDFERDFYSTLDKASWFEILKRKGVFDYKKNPIPIRESKFLKVSTWQPLIYLEKLSIQIKSGQHLELIDEIISIIREVSSHPTDNYKTWNLFISILCNIPSDKISVDIINFIPTWLRTDFISDPQAISICRNLLPKFLCSNPTSIDVQKAEVILSHLFFIEKKEIIHNNFTEYSEIKFCSAVNMNYLVDALIETKLTEKIAEFCSDNIVLELANKIKTILYDFQNGFGFSLIIGEKEFSFVNKIINAYVEILVYEKKDSELKFIQSLKLLDFEQYSSDELKNELVILLSKIGITYATSETNERGIEMFLSAIENGQVAEFSTNTISRIHEQYIKHDDLLNAFCLIFRNLVSDKVHINSKNGIALLQKLATDKHYKISFFKRTALFVIGKNWQNLNSLFWEILEKNNFSILSNQVFYNDLYELFNLNQLHFTASEISNLSTIILAHSQKRNENNLDYSHLRWYSALRKISIFKKQYEELSLILNLTHKDFENFGAVTVIKGSISPLTKDEILIKNGQELSKFIFEFKPKNRWGEPQIDGFAEAIGNVIETNPLKFSKEIEHFNDIYYIYAYHMAIGFMKAWKNKLLFDWSCVLSFFKNYITSEKFVSNELTIRNDGWNANQEWVTGALCNLLTEGIRSDDNSIKLDYKEIIKDILKIIIPRLKIENNFNMSKMDYPSHSLNSTSGKAIRTLLDYSLWRARNLNAENISQRWESDIKELFEYTINKEMVDSYIIIGWYFDSFYYLDKEWIEKKITESIGLEGSLWLGFINGFAFGNPPFNKEIYNLFYPHYEKIINNDLVIDNIYDMGIIKHLMTFYFWGFEDLEEEGLLKLFIQKGKPKIINQLITFTWQQEDYYKNLESDEAANFQNIIFNLWDCLSKKYENTIINEEINVLFNLLNLSIFIEKLDEYNSGLILKSVGHKIEGDNTRFLIDTLTALKAKGHPNETAKYLGTILNKIVFKSFLLDKEKEQITDVVTFLYINDQKQNANEICNKMVKNGHDFLIELYNKYNN